MGVEAAKGAGEGPRSERAVLETCAHRRGKPPACLGDSLLPGGETEFDPGGRPLGTRRLEPTEEGCQGGGPTPGELAPAGEDESGSFETAADGGGELTLAFVETEEPLIEPAARVVGEKTLAQPLDPRGQFVPVRDGTLGGSAGRGPIEVRGEIGEGAVGLVPEAGDHGHRTAANGTHDLTGIEGGEVFARAAAADEEHEIGVAPLGEAGERLRNVERGMNPLDRGGVETDRDERKSPVEHPEHVAHGGPAGRGHDRNAAGKTGERAPLLETAKEPFGGKGAAQLLELPLPCAFAAFLDVINDELKRPARLIDGRPAVDEDRSPGDEERRGRRPQAPREEDTADHRPFVAEREVTVPRGGCAQIEHLALDPEGGAGRAREPVEDGDEPTHAPRRRAAGEDGPLGDRGLGGRGREIHACPS